MQRERSLVRLIEALEDMGWRIVGLRPSLSDGRAMLWRVTIGRYDQTASITVTEAEPAVALAELFRYAQADAKRVSVPGSFAARRARKRSAN
jgi:hypothetical protein